MRIIKQSTRKHARLSLILLDWGVRETFHLLHYLKDQTVSREAFEVVVIEYYDTVSKAVGKVESEIDTWVLLEMPPECYYHKHLMYNAGTVLSGGEILLFGDSDAMVRPTFVETILKAFDRDRLIVYHMDEFRNIRRDLYPFNYPAFEDVLGEGCVNNFGNKTRGILDDIDPLHTRNYGACMCARRDDIIAIGGADEDLTYLGHICGPYDMTFRLMNRGRRLEWETNEYLYHTWHPGSDGIDNYFGPHDGKHMSTTAFETLCSGRIPPLVENKAVRRLRAGSQIGAAELEGLLIDSNYVRAFDRTALGSPPRRPVAPASMSTPVYGSYRGFDLYRVDGSFYAAPQSLHRLVLENPEWREDSRVTRGDSFTEIRDIIDGFGDPLAFQAELLEKLGTCNICAVGKRFAVVPIELGIVDFTVAQDRESPRIAWEGNLVEAFRTARRMNGLPPEGTASASELELASLQERIADLELRLSGVEQSRTWRTLTKLGRFFTAVGSMLGGRKRSERRA